MFNKSVMGLSFLSLCFILNTENVKAENFVCGADLDGDGYSDGVEETAACIKVDNGNFNFCPIQSQDCASTPVRDLDEATCTNSGGNWNGDKYEIVSREAYYHFSGNEDIVSVIQTSSKITALWRSYPFPKNANGSRNTVDIINGNSANKSAPWGGGAISGRDYQYSLGGGDRGRGTIYSYLPSEWGSYQHLPNGKFALYRVDEDYVNVYQWAVSNMQFIGSGWINASSLFNVGTNGLPRDYSPDGGYLESTNYYIKGQSPSNSNDGVYIKVKYKVVKPAHCSFDDGRTSTWVSPIEGGICYNVNGNYRTPTNTCVDFDTSEPEEEFDLSGNMLTDDGARDGEGNCVDELLLYTGRGQSCKKAGIDSAYQNCCSFDGEIANQDVGSYQQTALKLDAIKGMYSVGKAAYTAYSAALASGATNAAAASAAGSAAGTQMAVAFDPTTLAIAAGIYLVTEWMANACSSGDLETAAAKANGHCVEVGSYCSKRYKWIGCVQRKRSFCCFNGKMQRIFHEQGRPQLTTFNGFGTAKAPDCRGFTPQEFQSIDFSEIDLSEYYSDLNHNTSLEVNNVMTEKTKDFYESVQ